MHNETILIKCRLIFFEPASIICGMEARINLIIIVLLGLAVFSDLKTEKVPNGLIICGYAIGAFLCVHSPLGLCSFLWSIIWPILLLYPLFLIRGLGAGDIKLFSVLSVFFHYSILLQIMIYSLYVGAGICILRLAYSRVFQKKLNNYIHYTVCILAAYLIIFTQEVFL